jgi:hypothetical protein
VFRLLRSTKQEVKNIYLICEWQSTIHSSFTEATPFVVPIGLNRLKPGQTGREAFRPFSLLFK